MIEFFLSVLLGSFTLLVLAFSIDITYGIFCRITNRKGKGCLRD